MTPSQKFLAKIGLQDPMPTEQTGVNNKGTSHENSRRNFFKKSTLGGIESLEKGFFPVIANFNN